MYVTTRLVEDLRPGDILIALKGVRFIVEEIATREDGAISGPISIACLGFEKDYDGKRVRLTYRHPCVPVQIERDSS